MEHVILSTNASVCDLVQEFRQSPSGGPTRALTTWERFWAKDIGPVESRARNSLHVARLDCEIAKIRFRGLARVPVLMLGDDSPQVRQAVSPFVAETPSASLGIILCLTAAAHDFVLTASSLPPARYLVLSPDDVESLVRHPAPIERLRHLLLLQIPHHRLIPYSIAEPTEGAMFVGRPIELQMLMYENQDFAICGPGGVGKTSLLRQVQWLLRRQRDPRLKRIVEVDLLTCPQDLDLAAQAIAMRVSPSKRASEMRCSNLEEFLRRISRSDQRFVDGPIELIIDEADEILALDRRTPEGDHFYPLLRQLRSARLRGCIRLTISGRAETSRLLSDQKNPFSLGRDSDNGHGVESRFKLLEIGPLTESEARELLYRPLNDLGYPVNASQQALQKKLICCGGIPIQVQGLGLDLANEAARAGLLKVAL